jgi:hypothetical protein
MATRSLEEDLQTLIFELCCKWLKRVEQRLAASNYDRLRLALYCATNNNIDICRWVELRVPSVLCIAPLAIYIATTEADKVCRLACVKTLTLDGVKVLYQW